MSPRSWYVRAGLAASLMLFLVSIVRSQPGAREPLGPEWRRPVRQAIALAVSPEGKRVVVVSLAGEVTSYDSAGNPVWIQRFPGVDRAAIGRMGLFTAVYSARRPLARKAYFLDPLGRLLHTTETRDPIETVTLAPDGAMAAVASGRKIVFVALDRSGAREREIALDAEPRQMQFGPEDTLYVACRSPDQVVRVRNTGRVLWKTDPGPTDYSISSTEAGSEVAIACRQSADEIAISVVSATQKLLWRTLLPGRAPHIRLSAGGFAAVATYDHRLEHSARRRFERRLAYLGGPDQRGWFKGGAYTAPLSVSLDRAGDWVVALDTRQQRATPDFRLYGRNGERRWLYSAPANIVLAGSSVDGRSIAAYRADGVLELIRVSVP